MISSFLTQLQQLLGNLGSSTGSQLVDGASALPAEAAGALSTVAAGFGS